MARGRTRVVPDQVFRAVYDSPASLPGRHKWVTPEADVRAIEELLGMPDATIGAPLWVSGDRSDCPTCGRTITWLDIVASALDRVHGRQVVARVILGKERFVNAEVPRMIAGIRCSNCQTEIRGIRSFKCHNWAYAKPALLEVLEQIQTAEAFAGRAP